MEFVEEKSPKGFILKIFSDKGTFIAFDSRGKSIFNEEDDVSAIHNIPVLAFYGKNFHISLRSFGDYALFKVSKNKIVIPYNYFGDNNTRFLLVDTPEVIDMMPVKLYKYNEVVNLIKSIDSGIKPDLIVVDQNLSESDSILIKNRFAEAEFIVATDNTKKHEAKSNLGEISAKEADSVLSEINLNMMSENPIFLSRIHLKRGYFQKVKQLLLDFDLTNVDAGYILTFVNAQKNEYGDDPKYKKNIPILNELIEDFEFYVALLSKEKDWGIKIIEDTDNSNRLSSYATLLAKVRSMSEDANNLDFVDYENKIYEKKEELQSGSIDMNMLSKAVIKSDIGDEESEKKSEENQSEGDTIPEESLNHIDENISDESTNLEYVDDLAQVNDVDVDIEEVGSDEEVTIEKVEISDNELLEKVDHKNL